VLVLGAGRDIDGALRIVLVLGPLLEMLGARNEDMEREGAEYEELLLGAVL